MIKRSLVWLRGLADFFRGKKKIGFRQGDVMFFPIGDFPKDVELKPAGSVLRIQGEGSGHFHELKGVDVLTPVKPQIDWGWLVRVPKDSAITHNGAPPKEKHPDLQLSPGLYLVAQTRQVGTGRID